MCYVAYMYMHIREGGREGGRDGGKEGRKRGMEGGRDGGKEGINGPDSFAPMSHSCNPIPPRLSNFISFH